MRSVRAFVLLGLVASLGCSVKPPESQFPTGEHALQRLQATQACGTGVQATTKIDHFGDGGRVRATLLLFAKSPSSLRMDAVSPFGVTLATLTANGKNFSLADLRDKRFYRGPAEDCNIARLTGVPVPGHALVSLLRGDAPLLRHEPGATTLTWDSNGYYVVGVPSTREAHEEVRLGVHPDDFGKPWNQQRLRLLEVLVRQYDGVLYRARLENHRPAKMAEARVDPDGIDPPLPPSGPECHAELPEHVSVDVPARKLDVRLRYDEVTWNPPIPEGAFEQAMPGGLLPTTVTCAR